MPQNKGPFISVSFVTIRFWHLSSIALQSPIVVLQIFLFFYYPIIKCQRNNKFSTFFLFVLSFRFSPELKFSRKNFSKSNICVSKFAWFTTHSWTAAKWLMYFTSTWWGCSGLTITGSKAAMGKHLGKWRNLFSSFLETLLFCNLTPY